MMKTGLAPTLFLLLLAVADLMSGQAVPAAEAPLLHYLGLGFQHILPNGLDHIFFVLGLFFLSRNFTTLLWQITAFTLAHSLTFGLSLYGLVEAPARLVEVVVALSISFIALENLFSERLSPWRPWVVFGFGLVHGLAFAHTFREHDIPQEHFMPALFAFNIGIELGQLAVVALASACVAAFWNREWYRKGIAIPVSLVIGIVGLYWAGERMAFAF
jgi:HupE/UreJ protein